MLQFTEYGEHLMTIHRVFRELRFMVLRLPHLKAVDLGLAIFALLFAATFLVVGIMRVVEFSGLGFRPMRRKILIALHIAGCIALSSAMALFGLDVARVHSVEIRYLMGSAFIFLMPIQIYVNLMRRIKIRDAEAKRR
jgi:hypothetical protein